MQKKTFYSGLVILFAVVFTIACKKDSSSNNNNNTGKTKTELITSSTWKFDNAKIGTIDVSSYFDDCDKDNTVTFVSNGTGTADEGPTKCDPSDPQTVPFNWSFENNETTIHTSTPLFAGNGDFNLNILSDTQLAVARDTVLAGITQTFIITLKH